MYSIIEVTKIELNEYFIDIWVTKLISPWLLGETWKITQQRIKLMAYKITWTKDGSKSKESIAVWFCIVAWLDWAERFLIIFPDFFGVRSKFGACKNYKEFDKIFKSSQIVSKNLIRSQKNRHNSSHRLQVVINIKDPSSSMCVHWFPKNLKRILMSCKW